MRCSLPFVLFGTAVLTACVGDLEGSKDDESPSSDAPLTCEGKLEPGPAPIRRMTRFEFNNTVRDLLGDTTNPADNFGVEEEALGFNNNAANLVTSSTLAEKYMLTAEGIAERATDPLSKSVPCDPASIGEEECGAAFIDSFGQRAFRRPLRDAERSMFTALFREGLDTDGFRVGIQMVIQAALQSPPFLYRVEFGMTDDATPDEASTEAIRLDHWEMASRLSYFLWGTMPDEELFAAAQAGELGTPAEIEGQARRMLENPKARRAIEQFHVQWLDYDRIASVGKDAGLFPEYSPALGQLMRQETSAFVEHVVFDDDGALETLLTASYSFMNQELAGFYDVDGPTGEAFERVDLDPDERAGLMTAGSLLTINAHSNQTSPVHRGKLVREQFLCDTMPPPPADVMITVPEPDPDSTAKERFAQHSEDPACHGCHQLMDPIGFGFEGYDALGRYRTEENGQPIDTSGEIIQSDIDGPFTGALELATKLAGSAQVQSCYRTQWFRYAYGRGELDEDACSLRLLDDAFASGDIRELLVALTQTPAFQYRPRITDSIEPGGTP